MKLLEAKNIAEAISERLSQYCDIIDIAGSIRREKEFVGDIEVYCVPKTVMVGQGSLFGDSVEFARNESFISIANGLGEIIKGKSTGKYMQIALPQAINLDLFMPDDFDYYRQLAIRTGSSDYSFKVIASSWRKLGWCGSDHGLRKMSDCIESKGPDGKSKWKLINKDGEKPPVWKSEPEFFEWLNVKWIHPTQRNI
jgi:DNA polymerase/3'-5' exonuclease PolX